LGLEVGPDRMLGTVWTQGKWVLVSKQKFSYNADNDIATGQRASVKPSKADYAMGRAYKDNRVLEREESKSGYAGVSTGGSAAGKRLGMNA
jgi:hypothetical protein